MRINRILIAAIFSITLVSGLVAADHQVGHYDYTLNEGTFAPMSLEYPDNQGLDIEVTSNQAIDVLLLTPQQYQQCCGGDNLEEEYDYINDKSSLSTTDFSLRIQNGEGPFYLILDNTDYPTNGAHSRSEGVEISITLSELEENIVFDANELLVFITIFSLPVLVFFLIDAIRPGTADEILKSKISIQVQQLMKAEGMPGTYVIIILCTVLFFARLIFPAGGADFVESHTDWGALSSGSFFDGNVYEIITSNFYHFDIQHLAFNMFCLWILGSYLERKYTTSRYVAMLLIGGIFSSSLSLIYPPLVTSGGASGMVFCALGIITAEFAIDWFSGLESVNCQWHDMRWFWGTLALNIGFSFLPGISLLGHLGGFIGGLFVVGAMNTLGTLPPPSLNQDVVLPVNKREIHCEVCKSGLMVPVGYIGVVGCVSCGHQFWCSGQEDNPEPIDSSSEE